MLHIELISALNGEDLTALDVDPTSTLQEIRTEARRATGQSLQAIFHEGTPLPYHGTFRELNISNAATLEIVFGRFPEGCFTHRWPGKRAETKVELFDDGSASVYGKYFSSGYSAPMQPWTLRLQCKQIAVDDFDEDSELIRLELEVTSILEHSGIVGSPESGRHPRNDSSVYEGMTFECAISVGSNKNRSMCVDALPWGRGLFTLSEEIVADVDQL